MFYMMKLFQDQVYGNKASLSLLVDGWFAFDINQADRKYLVIPEDDHKYIAGDINFTPKKNLMETAAILISDAFENSFTGYCSLPNKRKSSYARNIQQLKGQD